jgi:hypothetical protein
MTFENLLKRTYVGKTIKSIVQDDGPTFLKEVADSFKGKKITGVWLHTPDPEYQRIVFSVEGKDYPLTLAFHENIELE